MFDEQVGDSQPAAQALKDKLRSLNLMVYEFVQAKNFSMARRIATASSALLESLDGVSCDEVIWAVSNRSFICSGEGRHTSATRYGRRAVQLTEDLYGRGCWQYALVLNNTGEILLEAGYLAESERYLKECIGILEQAIEQRSCDVSWALGTRDEALKNLGRVLRALGRQTEALELLDRICSPKPVL